MYKNRLKYFFACRTTNWQKYSSTTGISGKRAFSSGGGADVKSRGNELHKSDLHFNDGKLATQSKSFIEILRSVVILKLCTYDVFVDNSEKLVNWCKNIFGKQLYYKVVRGTFYKQFVAGEGECDVKDVAANLQKYNINCMFCVPTEEVSLDVLVDGSTVNGKEDDYEMNLKLLLGCVDLTAPFGGFAQSKITPVVSSDIMSDVAKLLINHLSNHKTRPAQLSVKTWAEALDGKSEEKLVSELSKASNGHIKHALRRLDVLAKVLADAHDVLNDVLKQDGVDYILSCKCIVMRAQEKGVKLMLDAEHTFLQASIDTIILALQKKYNQHNSVVYNTYQCYRKDTPARIQSDIKLAEKLGFKIACKLVRGAYMDFERQRAAAFGYPDPICDTYEETGCNYKKAMDLMLSVVAQGQGEVMFATHNEDCILYAIKRMDEMGIRSGAGSVCFGQLYGMGDHISYDLGNAGYLVHKSVPYGTIDHSILYLVRRAQENKSVMTRTSKETGILLDEIKRRIIRPFRSAKHLGNSPDFGR